MKRTIIISLHAGYWLVYLFLTVSTLLVAGNNFAGSVSSSIGLNLLLATTCFYTFYFVLVPKFLAKRQVRRFIAKGLLTGLVFALLMAVVQIAISSPDDTKRLTATDTSAVIINWTMIILFHATIGFVHGLLATFMRGSLMWYDDIHIRQTLEKKNLETQLSLIKARIDPHFLFNTLNNIDVMINNDPAQASIYLQKLCDIMRFTLYENHTEQIPLQKEVDIMRQYIELQKIRSSKDFISLDVTGDTKALSVGPMVLLPFVENAIKHSDGRKQEDAIRIKVTAEKDEIHFLCRNIVARNNTRSEGGIGMELIRQRLNLLYPSQYTLTVGEKNDYFEVQLTIHTK
jgi:two-component system, LytTR family, sensor kinase